MHGLRQMNIAFQTSTQSVVGPSRQARPTRTLEPPLDAKAHRQHPSGSRSFPGAWAKVVAAARPRWSWTATKR